MFRPKYRIVTAPNGFYKVEIKLWYWPWWGDASPSRAGHLGFGEVLTLPKARALVSAHLNGTLGKYPFRPEVVEEYSNR